MEWHVFIIQKWMNRYSGVGQGHLFRIPQSLLCIVELDSEFFSSVLQCEPFVLRLPYFGKQESRMWVTDKEEKFHLEARTNASAVTGHSWMPEITLVSNVKLLFTSSDA